MNLADRIRAPDSAEQVLHPDKWIRIETPLPVRPAKPRLGPGWRRTATGTLGEWATREFEAALRRWSAGRDGAAVVNRSGAVTLALAPTAARARRAAAG